MLSLIVAHSENNVIGNHGNIPWKLSTDLKRFAQLTKGHSVIMGRKTYESILQHIGKPLPDRKNIVVTRQNDFEAPGCIVVNSFTEAKSKTNDTEETFVIGGAQLYAESLPNISRIYLTIVHTICEGDAIFPEIEKEDWKVISQEEIPADEKNQYSSTFKILERK